MLPRIEIMFSLAKTKTSMKYSISDSLVNSQAVFAVLWFPISLNPFRQIRKFFKHVEYWNKFFREWKASKINNFSVNLYKQCCGSVVFKPFLFATLLGIIFVLSWSGFCSAEGISSDKRCYWEAKNDVSMIWRHDIVYSSWPSQQFLFLATPLCNLIMPWPNVH